MGIEDPSGGIVHPIGTGETDTHVELTERLVDRLIEQGKSYDNFAYPNCDHGLSGAKVTTVHVQMLITRYLLDHLPPGPR